MQTPRRVATFLAIVGVSAGQSATEAAEKARPTARPTQTRPQPAPATPALTTLPVVDGGKAVGETTPEKARKDGLTVVDLSDEWLPYIFSEEPDKTQPMRPYLVDLANGRFRGGANYARAREDRFFEVFGIPPSLGLVRRRLADKKRHECHERVKDAVLEGLSPKNVIPAEEAEKVPNPDKAAVAAGDAPAMIPTGRTISPRPLTETEKKAVIAMQAHLRCEGLMAGRAVAGRMDRRTVEGLKAYQRLQTLADNGSIDLDTRTALLGDSREQDFRLLLRALRERVADASGLIEDGSALGVLGEVQGRLLDSNEFRPVAMPADGKSTTEKTPEKPSATDTSAKVVPAPDLIAVATQAASQALGWTSPEAVLASTLVAPPAPSAKPAKKGIAKGGPAPLPAAVAMRLPPPPPYHGPTMALRAEIDRGDVVLERPKLDKDGHKKWKPPVADRPTLTLYARDGNHEVALCRWPTTIGGWKTFEKSDGSMALKYKESVTGDALWPELLVGPTWHPATGMPTRRLLVKQGDGFVPKTEIIGPGYRAAYGLVAITHHQITGTNDKGEPDLMDFRIRTHGTPGYRAVKRGESNGCHRLHNFEALRLSGFLIKHHGHVRDGLVPEDYVRHLKYKGHEVDLQDDTKGYRFKLTPPVPVKVLSGDVRGNARAVKGMIPLTAVP
jgi:hypothetical protein